MNPFQNPLERMFLRWSASSGAQALLTAGMLVGLIGVLGVSLRGSATIVSTVLMVIAAGTGFVAMALGGAAWAAAIVEDLDRSKQRARVGSWWWLGSFATLVVAGLVR